MKAKILVGIILALSSIFCSCEKLDVTKEGYKYKVFGMPETKASVSIIWSKGDNVCIYSLDENNTIIYKDTAEVTNISNNKGTVKALVAKQSYRYFATYPEDAIKSEIGDKLNDEDFRVRLTGTIKDVSVMTCYVDTSSSVLWFENRFALAKIESVSKGSVITVESSFPSSVTVPSKTSNYYIPLTYLNEKIKLEMKSGRLVRTWENKNKPVNIDTIYNIN